MRRESEDRGLSVRSVRPRWGGGFFARRRPVVTVRRDPVRILREIIEPCDGVDRSTVELLAEEEGLARDLVDRTLARLCSDGSVRYERGPDGEEVFAWAFPS